MSRRFLLSLLACALSCTAPLGFGESGDDNGLPPTRPALLSQTGLYADSGARTLAPGVITYAPAHPLWSDGSDKTRYLRLPPGTQIDTSQPDNWIFPAGTKVWKEFRVGGKLVETRLLWKHGERPGIDSWWYAAYVWNDSGSDAVESPKGTPSALGTTHDVPSTEDCKGCHLYVRDAVIGFSALELSPPQGAAALTAEPGAGLLRAFAQQGLFTEPPKELTIPGDGVARDALGYLHGNCGFCHNARMADLIARSMRLRVLSSDATLEQTGAYKTTFGAKMYHEMEGGADKAVVPGSPEQSQLYRRMLARDRWLMPPKGTKVVDPTGSAFVRAWIEGLPR